METEIKNAIIIDATIEIERGSFLTAWIYLDYGGSGQGFGGICLYNPEHKSDSPTSFQWAGDFLFGVMDTIGVEKWEDLKGKAVRVKADNSKVHAIGHIIQDRWFYPGPKPKKKLAQIDPETPWEKIEPENISFGGLESAWDKL